MPDILENTGPALSATSDMPEVSAPEQTPAPELDAVETTAEAAGEGEAPEAGEQGAEENAATDAPETPPQPAPKQNSYQRRISELAAARRAAEERADRAIAALEAFAKQHQPLPPTEVETRPDAPPPAPEPRPARDDFADPDAYDAALIEWSARQTARITAAETEKRLADQRAADEKARADAAAKTEFDRVAATWGERRAKAIEAHPDFIEVAENPRLMI